MTRFLNANTLRPFDTTPRSGQVAENIREQPENVRSQFHSLRQPAREVVLWATDGGQKKRKIGADLVSKLWTPGGAINREDAL